MQSGAVAAGSPEQKNWLNMLVAATMRMSSLIDDLLSLSRAASTELRLSPIDLSAVANSILATLAHGSERRIDWVVADHCVGSADEGLITVMLDNLLRNAWKYSSRTDPAHIQFGCREEGEETIFFVRDNGAGFDGLYADRLFRPFQRLHSQSEFPGTGVGLATVERIIGRHGGRVWATGAVRQGAEFCFTLPRKANSNAAVPFFPSNLQ